MTSGNMHKLLAPRSVALVGVSAQDRGFGINGRTVLNHLVRHGYQGEIIPIHKQATEIAGLATAPSLAGLGKPVDCAVIAVPAAAVAAQLDECVEAGIATAIVLSARFAETGGEGIALQEALTATARRAGMLVCGPNTTGLVNVSASLAMSATASLQNRTLRPGPVAFVTQSGAVGGALLDRAAGQHLGLSYVIGTGNEAVLDVSDYIEYLLADDDTQVIGLYLESLRNVSRFLSVASRARAVGKSIVAFKVGRTSVGTTAALSHTGSVAGDYDSQRAAMTRAGVIVVDSLDDVVDVAAAAALGARPVGHRIGIFTFSGGIGISLADLMSGRGFEFPEPSAQTAAELRAAMGPLTVAINPLDVPPNIYAGSVFRDGLAVYAAAPEFDATVVVLMPVAAQRLDQVIAGIDEASRRSAKPLYVCWFTGDSSPGPGRLMELGIPCFTSLRAATMAVRHALDQRAETSVATPARAPAAVSAQRDEPGAEVARSEWESRSLLQRFGLPLCDARLVDSPEAAAAAAAEVGLPAVVKGISARLTHKGSAGLVRVGLRSLDEVHAAYLEIRDRLAELDAGAPPLAMVQPMISADVEVMIGLRMDPELGPVVVFGQGGVLTELLGDHATDLAPRDEADAERLILATRIGRALAQGSPAWPAIRDQLIGVLIGLGAAARSGEPLTTIELNPLRVSLNGPVIAVDALVVGPAVT